jgi:hypothetical protein
MPDTVAWPRTGNGAPLQFVAQVSCADLPKALWAGLGPRSGWLLLFANCYAMGDADCGGNVQVLHVTDLGPEREPPDDMGTYRHAMVDYIDYHTPVVRPGIPKMWRRWPVDIVVQDVPPPYEENGSMVWAPSRVDAEALYGGLVDGSYLKLSQLGGIRPLTWRGVLYLLDAILDRMKSDLREAHNAIDRENALELPEGFVVGAIAKALAKRAESLADIARSEAKLVELQETKPDDRAEADRLAGWLERLRTTPVYHERNIADLSPYAVADGDAALSVEARRSRVAYRDWLLAQQRLVVDLRAELVARDLDSALPEAEWDGVRARLTATRSGHWFADLRHQTARKFETDLMSRHSHAMDFALREEARDLYTRDATGQAMLSPGVLAALEPRIREIGGGDAPHRMGGPYDAVQEADQPRDSMLLFQIFSDFAMSWKWADGGGLFVRTPASALKAGTFGQIEAWIDGG